jgi:hypothetical protein
MTSTINASTTAGIVTTADTSGVLALQTAGTTAVTVDASQNVGIGTTSPTNYANQRTLAVNGTTYGRIDLMAGGTVYGSLYGGTGGPTLSTGSALPVMFETNGSERMRINAGAPILCLVGGSTTATGTGIAFPATQSASTNANTLDDYEEGTWTPTLGGTSTYTKQVGEYVKVGQSVIYAGAISVGSIGTGSATGAISGLPFTAANIDVNAGKAGAVSYFNALATSIASLGIYVDNAGTTLQTTTVAAGGATSTGTASIFQNSSKIDFAGSYKSSS